MVADTNDEGRPAMTPVPPPLVSVVVPCRNNATTIGEVLAALAAQTYQDPFEIVLVDNGSTDDTAQVVSSWADRLPGLLATSCTEPGKAPAVNHGVSVATGSLLALCDADDRVAPTWLASAVEALGRSELATGPVDLSLLNPVETYAWRAITGWDEQPDWHDFLPTALGCNLAVRRATFEQLGGYVDGVAPAEDTELVWRAQLAGATLGFAPGMLVHWRLRATPWAYLERHVAYGRGLVACYARFASDGMPRQLGRGILRWGWVVLATPLLLVRRQRYRWLAIAGTAIGHVVGSLRYRVLYL